MYASQTMVSVDKSRSEIERLLMRHGAQGFAYATEGNSAMIGFRHNNLAYKIFLPLPEREQFNRTPKGRKRRYAEDAERAWEQACRSHWRALGLIVKAKLEAVALGITTIEKEFAPDLIMGDGRTLYEHTSAAIVAGKVPKALPYFGPVIEASR
jgi:hypothetical protein